MPKGPTTVKTRILPLLLILGLLLSAPAFALGAEDFKQGRLHLADHRGVDPPFQAAVFPQRVVLDAAAVCRRVPARWRR